MPELSPVEEIVVREVSTRSGLMEVSDVGVG